ncbi:MAG: metallophosphoesterase [Lentisphaeria bacterium]|nr:metallophosphoesterase [Lentisphaeria bacterium]
MMKKLCVMLLCLGAAALSAQELTILQSTDIHGRESIAQIGTIIDRERAVDKDVIVIDCGDISNGSPSAYTDTGASMIACLNAFGYDVFVPGNHEFRIGNKAFRRNCDLFTSGKVLAANVEFDDPAKAPEKLPAAWTMLERKGLKIAVIGIACNRYDNWIGFSL